MQISTKTVIFSITVFVECNAISNHWKWLNENSSSLSHHLSLTLPFFHIYETHPSSQEPAIRLIIQKLVICRLSFSCKRVLEKQLYGQWLGWRHRNRWPSTRLFPLGVVLLLRRYRDTKNFLPKKRAWRVYGYLALPNLFILPSLFMCKSHAPLSLGTLLDFTLLMWNEWSLKLWFFSSSTIIAIFGWKEGER